jgi:hypothetical protein
VVLVGSPLGLENTVSTGIVSGRRQEPEGYALLQVSAPASRGSSGGAVLGIRGQVVGIAASQIGGGQNLNFAVPINYARGLLTHLGGEPLAVLRPTSTSSDDTTELRLVSTTNTVNGGLNYALDDFQGYRTEMEVALDGNRHRRTRITYRLIQTIAGGEPLIERYLESETTRVSEPFGTVQTLQRERSRVVVRATGLRPVSARGETSSWNGSDWRTASHELQFDGDHVVGLFSDTTGHTVELDRDLPSGIVLRDMRDLAFAVLDTDQVVGRSVEFTTFDPRSGEIDRERYDVLREEVLEIDDNEYDVLRVNVATGLDNEIFFVRAEAPRLLLRRVSDDGSEIEILTSLEMGPSSR